MNFLNPTSVEYLMSVMIEGLLLALCFALLVSASVLFTQVLFSLSGSNPARSNPRSSTAPRPRIAVLIPAHDEEEMIADTLSSIMAQLCSGDRIVVVLTTVPTRLKALRNSVEPKLRAAKMMSGVAKAMLSIMGSIIYKRLEPRQTS